MAKPNKNVKKKSKEKESPGDPPDRSPTRQTQPDDPPPPSDGASQEVGLLTPTKTTKRKLDASGPPLDKGSPDSATVPLPTSQDADGFQPSQGSEELEVPPSWRIEWRKQHDSHVRSESFLADLEKEYDVLVTPKDGNCLFSTLSYLIWGEKTTQGTMKARSHVCSFMGQNRALWANAVLPPYTPETYLNGMMRATTWGGDPEVAMAQLWLKTRIVILSPTEVVPPAEGFPRQVFIVAVDSHFMPAFRKGVPRVPLASLEELASLVPSIKRSRPQ